MQKTFRSRGMTLVEVMVAAAIGAFVMVGISSAFIAQARQYHAQAGRRDAQSAARTGLSYIEDKLRLAGYGVDPHLNIIPFDSYDVAADALAPDTSFPDALVVHARDTDFRRTIAANGASQAQVQISPPLTEPILRGQILLAICAGAQQYAYVTAAARANAGDASISLSAPGGVTSPIREPGPRYRESAQLDLACFDTGEAMLVKVNRYAFFIGSFDDDQSQATVNVPYLMLHRGLDLNNDGTVDVSDATPVAPGVEQMQVSYVMNTRPGQPVVVRGTDPADRVPDIATWDQQINRPRWNDSYTHDRRYADHPSNIRQVRVTLVSRNENPIEAIPGDDMFDQTAPAWASGTANGVVIWRQLENLTNPAPAFRPEGGGFVRTVMRVAVSPKNLLMRSQFLPPTFGG